MLEKWFTELVENQKLPVLITTWKELKGGTESTVVVLGTEDNAEQYVLKSNTPERIEEEVRFFKVYREVQLLPTIRYVDPEHRFVIYDYVPGTTDYQRGTKQELLADVIRQFVRYYVKPESAERYEWIESPECVEEGLKYARGIIGERLQDVDHDLVWKLHETRKKRLKWEDAFVLHGDFGVHNFLFENGELSGIIDPMPVVGRKLYDVLYAFCSSPDELEFSVLWEVVPHLGEETDETELIEDVMIALYSRIATCIKYHPDDLHQYLNRWEYWKELWKCGGGK